MWDYRKENRFAGFVCVCATKLLSLPSSLQINFLTSSALKKKTCVPQEPEMHIGYQLQVAVVEFRERVK